MEVLSRNSFISVSGIYCLTNIINNKKYIGRTCCLYSRIVGHRKSLIKGNHANEYLQKSWNKYGSDAFEVEVLCLCSVDSLNSMEEHYMTFYDSMNMKFGYNLMSYKNGSLIVSELSKLKQSLSKKGKAPIKALKRVRELCAMGLSPNLGIKHSEATRKKMSDSAKGRDPKKAHQKVKELIEAGKNPYLNRIITKDTKLKIQETKKNWSDEKRLQYHNKVSKSLKERGTNYQDKICFSKNLKTGEVLQFVSAKVCAKTLSLDYQILRRICSGERKNKEYQGFTFYYNN